MRPGPGFSSKAKAIAILLIVAASVLAVNQFTGLVSEILRIDMSVAPSVQGNIYIINPPGTVIQDQQTNFTFALDNIGSRQLDGSILVEIRDTGNSTVDSFSSGPYSIQPGSYITYLAAWYAGLPPGNYTVMVWDNVTSPTDSDASDFSIECPAGEYRCFGNERRVCGTTSWNLVETCVYGCSGGSCLASPGGGGGVSEAGTAYSVEVGHDGGIDVVQGINYTYIIRVTNDGPSPITNVSLRAWSDDVEVRVPDISVSVLAPGESASFVVDLGVPVIDLGDYEVGWEMTSREVVRTGSFVVSLVSLYEEYTHDQECSDAIERYFNILDSLDKDVRSAEIRGYDMERTRELLREATDEFEVMRTLMDNGLFEECGNRVDVLRRKIEQTAMVYSIAISRPISIIAYPWFEHIILIFTIIALVVVIVLIVLWRRIREWYGWERLYRKSRSSAPSS